MAIQSRSLTYDDLRRIRETRDEQLELIDGELFVNPAPSRLHQLVSKRLSHLLKAAVDDLGLGDYYYAPFDVKLGPGDIVQPDLVVVLRNNYPIFTEGGAEGVPDFVVEIIWPSNDEHDRVRKLGLYARYGVPKYWLVDPDARRHDLHQSSRRPVHQ